MKDYVYRRTVAELQERSCELKHRTGAQHAEAIRACQPTEPDYRSASTLSQGRVYRIYTEDRLNLSEIVSRYFSAFTILDAGGFYEGKGENSAVIEVIATPDTLQTIIHLAGDIKHRNAQSSVLVTWLDVSRLDV